MRALGSAAILLGVIFGGVVVAVATVDRGSEAPVAMRSQGTLVGRATEEQALRDLADSVGFEAWQSRTLADLGYRLKTVDWDFTQGADGEPGESRVAILTYGGSAPTAVVRVMEVVMAASGGGPVAAVGSPPWEKVLAGAPGGETWCRSTAGHEDCWLRVPGRTVIVSSLGGHRLSREEILAAITSMLPN